MVPLLVVPFVLYNIAVFVFFGGNPVNWGAGLFSIPMPSGMPWAITAGDLLLVVGILALFFEVLKSTQTARNSILEHMFSMLLFVLFLIEFLLVGAASSSVFFLLMVMSLIDVVAGFTVSITSASRDVSMS
ncbi:membrane protein [Devosia riboflavina]|uniref:Membrane protein n=1 Tax=Devosia riboflavina TaxID=46914 RepID=A0A087LXF3_9HYPH|nr:membrane protein [Devosia riboflavina]